MAPLFVILQVSHFAATWLHPANYFFRGSVWGRASLTNLFGGPGQYGPVPGPAVGTGLARQPDVFRELLGSSGSSTWESSQVKRKMDDDSDIFDEMWLESVVIAGFRVWHIIAAVLGVLLLIMIMVCCCIRFRIPRTKQEIEADYQRKQITKKFREKLQQIKNSEMDDMDLQKVCARIQSDYLSFQASMESMNAKQNVKFKI
ncbi:uncharacterized protein LOC6529841 [Drosophila yakuba]|nr:uncharacterized protein LOC6529841 [Drosophila yakuba]